MSRRQAVNDEQSTMCWLINGDSLTTVTCLRRLMALAALTLIAATWPLWQYEAPFPRVGLLRFANDWTRTVGNTSLAMLITSLVLLVVAWSPRFVRMLLAVFVVALSVLVVENQHRLQPWAWQFVISAVVLLAATPGRCVSLLRVFTVGIYFYSGLSKLDATFIRSFGQQLSSAMVEPFGLTFEPLSPDTRAAIAALLPLGEMAVAAGLCFSRVRTPALCGAVAMHAGLLLALGPWGLGHRPGVLIWNVWFAIQTWLLFRTARDFTPKPESSQGASESRTRFMNGVAALVVGTVSLLPLLENAGWFDHWPSWSLYATRRERVRVFVTEAVYPTLPAEIRPYVSEAAPFDDWRPLRLDRLSLETVNSPLYPEVRFQFGVALAVAERFALGDEIQVRVEGLADRWTGRRSEVVINGADELRAACSEFVFNAIPAVNWGGEGTGL